MQLLDFFVQEIAHFGDVFLCFGGDEEGFGAEFRHPGGFEFVEGDVLLSLRGEVVFGLLHPGVLVYLVENDDGGLAAAVDFVQGFLYRLNLLLEVGMADIDDVQQQVRFADLRINPTVSESKNGRF